MPEPKDDAVDRQSVNGLLVMGHWKLGIGDWGLGIGNTREMDL
jgi:hypothetical protein